MCGVPSWRDNGPSEKLLGRFRFSRLNVVSWPNSSAVETSLPFTYETLCNVVPNRLAFRASVPSSLKYTTVPSGYERVYIVVSTVSVANSSAGLANVHEPPDPHVPP